MTTLKLFFFGPGQVLLAPDTEAKIQSRKEFALLAYLALERDRAISRESILGLLWPELGQDAARNNLRVALARLRNAIHHAERPLIHSDRHTLRFDDTQPDGKDASWLDVAEFDRLLALVDSHEHADPIQCRTCLADMVRAADLYGGEFLHGFHLDECEAFDHWLLVQRERYHMQAMALLSRLEAAQCEKQDWKAAEKTARQRLALDTLDESAHRSLMQIFALSGLRNAALAHYDICVRLLDEELGVGPDDETVHLAEAIRAGELTAAALSPSAKPPAIAFAETRQPASSEQQFLNPYAILSRLEPLPDQLLFGVDNALATVGAALTAPDRSWLVSIEGIGGLGKTTLAHTLVKQLLEGGAQANDTAAQAAGGVHYQDIGWVSAKQQEYLPDRGVQATGKAALDEEALMDQLLAQLADGPYPTGNSREKRVALTQLLKEKVCLVVVDNLETAIDYQALLPLLRHLANPSKFLITSRMSLAGQGDVFAYSLAELSADDALAFIRHEATNRGMVALTAATDEQLLPIYATVGGNPLALKLVLGQLQFLPLDQILASLRQADSYQTDQLYTYIYWQTWQMLDATSRHLLLCLPVVPNATFAQLTTISGLATAALQRAIMTLRSLSLVELGGDLNEPRYRLHRLTETFLMHEVVKWQEPDLHSDSAEAQYFVQRVLAMVEQWRTAEAVHQVDVTILDHEYEAVVKAISLGLELPQGWTMVKPLIIAFTPFMERRGHWHHWHGILERAIEVAQQQHDSDGEITLTALLARLCKRESHPQDVVRLYRRVIRLARGHGNRYEEARACSNLGYAFIDGGQWWRSEVLSCHALALFEELGSEHGRAHTHNHLGLLYIRCHQWQAAKLHLTHACTLWGNMGDEFNLVNGYSNLGLLYIDLSQPQEALPHLQRALSCAELTGETANIGLPLLNLGIAYFQAGMYEEAETQLRRAESTFRTFAKPLELARAWGTLGELYLATEAWDAAERYFKAALKSYQELNNWDGAIKTLFDLADYELAHGNEGQAQRYLGAIEAYLQKHGPTTQSYSYIVEKVNTYRTHVLSGKF